MSPFPKDRFLELRVEDELCLSRVRVMRGFVERGLGLIFRPGMPEAWGQALLFPRTRELHGIGMRFELDVLFLDEEGQILIHKNLRPGRMVRGPKSCRHCLEAPAGTLKAWQGSCQWLPQQG